MKGETLESELESTEKRIEERTLVRELGQKNIVKKKREEKRSIKSISLLSKRKQ